MRRFAAAVVHLGLPRTGRVGIYLEKRFETVIASFGAPAAGGVFVPMNPLLKAEQVAFIAQDCNVQVLVTSPERLALLAPVLAACPDLRHTRACSPSSCPPAQGRPAASSPCCTGLRGRYAAWWCTPPPSAKR